MMTFERSGAQVTGTVTRIMAELNIDGRRSYKTLTENDLTNQSEASDAAPAPTAPRWDINQKFEFMNDLINMVVDGITCSLMVTGSGGLGKTRSVMKALEAKNLVDGGDYVKLTGYSTPRGLYEFLYRNNGKLLIIDDCDSVFDTDTGVNVLKGALDSYDTRTVCWQGRETSRDDDEDAIPRSFEFTGRVIFISNRTQEDVPQPIRSRSMNVDLTMNIAERLDRIQSLLPALAQNAQLTNSEAAEAFNVIKDNAAIIRDINIRTMVMTLRVRKSHAHADWKQLAIFQLVNN